MAKRNADRDVKIIRGTRNVFADLGYLDAKERQAKLRLAYAWNQVLDERKLTQSEAAKVLAVTQPKVSALRRYKLSGFSVERLMTMLTALDRDVQIVIKRKPRSRRAARISGVAAGPPGSPRETSPPACNLFAPIRHIPSGSDRHGEIRLVPGLRRGACLGARDPGSVPTVSSESRARGVGARSAADSGGLGPGAGSRGPLPDEGAPGAWRDGYGAVSQALDELV